MLSRPFLVAVALAGAALAQEQPKPEDYKLGPDSERKPDVPKGQVLKQAFNAGPNSVFPGTERDYWVYVPKQYDGTKPAALTERQSSLVAKHRRGPIALEDVSAMIRAYAEDRR